MGGDTFFGGGEALAKAIVGVGGQGRPSCDRLRRNGGDLGEAALEIVGVLGEGGRSSWGWLGALVDGVAVGIVGVGDRGLGDSLGAPPGGRGCGGGPERRWVGWK
jgi:hypothetical protein